MRTVKLPSGATLTVNSAPFADAKRLWQAVTREMRPIRLSLKDDVQTMLKDVFCAAYSSEEIDACMAPCLERCLYNGTKVDKDTFEPDERRQDFIVVCMEVARENVGPFLKSLYANWKQALETIDSSLESKPKTTTS